MKAITILFIFFSSFAIGQTLQKQVLYDTTRTDGHRFIIDMPYEVKILLTDSVTWINDTTAITEQGYYSLVNSYALFEVKRQHIVGGDTLTKFGTVKIPLYKIGNNAVQFLTAAPTRKQVKKEVKPWIQRKLQEE